MADRDDVRVRGPGRRAADPPRARACRKVATAPAARPDVRARRRERRDRGESRRLGGTRGGSALIEQTERRRGGWGGTGAGGGIPLTARVRWGGAGGAGLLRPPRPP